MRVLARVKELQTSQGYTLITDSGLTAIPTEKDSEFLVNTFMVRDRTMEIGKLYEFLGEIEQVTLTNHLIQYSTPI